MSRTPHAAALVMLAAAAALSACVMPADRVAADKDIGRWRPVEAQRARIEIDRDAGVGVVAAREKRTAQGEMIEELMLGNDTAAPGENTLTLAVDYGPASFLLADPYAVKVGQYAMTPAAMPGTMRAAFPKAQIAATPEIRANRYGPYSYLAAEYAGTARCVYAWQVVSSDQTGGPSFRKASVQLRVCGRTKDPIELLKTFDTFRLAL